MINNKFLTKKIEITVIRTKNDLEIQNWCDVFDNCGYWLSDVTQEDNTATLNFRKSN